MTITKRMLILAAVALLDAQVTSADTPQIGNIAVVPRDAKTAQVRFDLTWPNAARPGVHHVALWVFFKARAEGNEWRHVRLVADKVLNPTGYGQTGGVPLEFVVPDGLPSEAQAKHNAKEGKDPAGGGAGGTGMFLRRTQDWKGTLTASNITALISLETLNTEHRTLNTNLLAFAIEMAYVPEGPFEVGASGQNPRNRLFAYAGKDVTRTERNFQTDHSDFADNTPPYRITGPGPIPTGRQPGKLWAQGLTPEDGGEIPATFPNGFAAFYCMRDVISQGQYAAFLNTLTDAQARERYYPDGHGPEIKRSGTPSNFTYTASAPEEHCVWLSWADGAAYAAWAGLRPMTELEYEKANRSGSDIRNLNVGSLFERQVSIGSAVGRKFAGSHGGGTPVLPEDWPRDLSGVVFRGDLDGSHRGSLAGRNAASNVQTDRSLHPPPGWRAVRSAPAGDTGVKANPVYCAVTRPVARLARAMRADGTLTEWDKPVATLRGPDDLYPERFRQPPPKEAGDDTAFWQGDKDLSAKVYLGWDADALCVAVEAADDKHFNTYASQDIGRGDCLTLDLSTPQGRWRIGLALTKTGVTFHQWQGPNDELAKTSGLAVVRDNPAGMTRYELRLPLAALGLEPGKEFGFSAAVFDDDDGFGQAYGLQLAGGRFMVAE